jgi:hypothetical protein
VTDPADEQNGTAYLRMGGVKIFRFLVDCSVLLLVNLMVLSCYAQSVTPAKNLDAVIANAKMNSDYKGERRATNLKYALSALRRVYNIADFGPDTKGDYLTANTTEGYLATSDRWVLLGTAESQLVLTEAQEYANQGKAIRCRQS